MRKESAKGLRTNYRARRLIGGAVGFGAIATALIMALSPIAAAGATHPAGASLVSWWAYGSNSYSGCGTASSSHAKFSPATALAHWKGKVSAKACTAAHGGTHVSSSGSTYGEVTVNVPIKHLHGVGGVNVTWSINVLGASHATNVLTAPCPTTYYNYSYYYNNSYYVYNYTTGNYTIISTWYNSSSASSSCSSEANMDVYGYAYLIDTTTNTYYYSSNYWSGLYNTSGMYQYNSTYSATYSNPQLWANNYSYSYGSAFHYGATGSLSSAAPTWFINGTFTGSHKYVAYTYIDNSAYASVYGVPHGVAAATMNGATLGYGEMLSITVW